MDYPTAWAFVREQHPDFADHDPRCSWVIANRERSFAIATSWPTSAHGATHSRPKRQIPGFPALLTMVVRTPKNLLQNAGIRTETTRDARLRNRLGKPTLYQLSYVRKCLQMLVIRALGRLGRRPTHDPNVSATQTPVNPWPPSRVHAG